MRLLQCAAGLAEEMDCTFGRQRAVSLDQLFQVQAGKVFHRVIERAVFGMAVIEDLDRIRVRQGGCGLHLALEAEQVQGSRTCSAR